MSPATEVTAAEVSRNFAVWQDKAMTAPVVVTRHGKPRVVLLSADAFSQVQADTPATKGELALEQKLSLLLNHLIEGFVAFDAKLRIIEVNPAFEAMVNASARQMIGHTLPEVFERVQPLFLDFLRRTMLSGNASEFEMPSVLITGRVYRVRPFPYADGVAAVLQSRFEDHALKGELAALRARVQAAEALPGVGSALLTLRGAFADANAAFCELIGLDAEALRGTPFMQLIRPSSREAAMVAMEACFEGDAPCVAEAVLFTGGVAERAVSLAFAPVRDDTVTGVRVSVSSR